MPKLIRNRGQRGRGRGDMMAANFEYQYPNDLDLKPGSDLHEKLKREILNRADESADMMSRRWPSWRQIDRVLTAFVPLDEVERKVKDDDDRKPVSIVYPYTYALLEALVSYMDSVFLNGPIFQYSGNSPEDTIGAALLEKVIDVHCTRNKIGLPLHTGWKDGLAYGIGAIFPSWVRQFGYKTRGNTDPLTGEVGRVTSRALLFEGNRADTIDPYLLLLDPNIGAQDPQRGEYLGFVDHTNLMNLLSAESEKDATLFNVKYLKILGDRQTAVLGTDETGRFDKQSGRHEVKNDSIVSPVDVVHLYVKLIPKDWGLGSRETPEKWFFTLAGDEVIIRAQPLNLDHDMFPAVVCAPTFDGYSPTPLSRLELVFGMQSLLDWLFNSHTANVRKAINDMLIVDPYLVNMDDLKSPQPGKLVRLRRAGWGKGVQNVVQQLNVNDITRGNVMDSTVIMQLMQKISGADEHMLGALRQGGPERLTTAEFQGTHASQLGRLNSMVHIVQAQVHQDLAYMFAMHTQQLMSEELYVTTAGRWQETLARTYGASGMVKVSPFDLMVDFDVKIDTPFNSRGNFTQFWVQMFQTIAAQPELYQLFDLGRIFQHVALQTGEKNVHDFLRVQVQPNDMIQNEVQKGNMLPIEEVANALRGA